MQLMFQIPPIHCPIYQFDIFFSPFLYFWFLGLPIYLAFMLIGTQSVRVKRKVVWIFAIFPTLIGLCSGNGVGDSRRKITLCGGVSSF